MMTTNPMISASPAFSGVDGKPSAGHEKSRHSGRLTNGGSLVRPDVPLELINSTTPAAGQPHVDLVRERWDGPAGRDPAMLQDGDQPRSRELERPFTTIGDQRCTTRRWRPVSPLFLAVSGMVDNVHYVKLTPWESPPATTCVARPDASE
ncbi:hypothetical protein [Spirillospora sp. NBC_01491]|uniref:hypothetical protein n=1 Tax=Spirillospora sp. NBC_01491 TaxID=2976007 RepID=UPI002E30138E|nr:hypothetical protein [Spirillospora sp. NBC_01491]